MKRSTSQALHAKEQRGWEGKAPLTADLPNPLGSLLNSPSARSCLRFLPSWEVVSTTCTETSEIMQLGTRRVVENIRIFEVTAK